MNYEMLAVVLTGKIGSGKSYAAKILQLEGWHVVSAGGLIRKMCEERGMPTDRETLQSFGRELLAAYGEQHFGRLMLSQASVEKKVVFEGIRPAGAVREIRRLVKTLVVYIDSSPDKRLRRLQQRDGTSPETFLKFEKNELESLVVANKSIADLVISNNGSEDEFRQKILGLINEKIREL